MAAYLHWCRAGSDRVSDAVPVDAATPRAIAVARFSISPPNYRRRDGGNERGRTGRIRDRLGGTFASARVILSEPRRRRRMPVDRRVTVVRGDAEFVKGSGGVPAQPGSDRMRPAIPRRKCVLRPVYGDDRADPKLQCPLVDAPAACGSGDDAAYRGDRSGTVDRTNWPMCYLTSPWKSAPPPKTRPMKMFTSRNEAWHLLSEVHRHCRPKNVSSRSAAQLRRPRSTRRRYCWRSCAKRC